MEKERKVRIYESEMGVTDEAIFPGVGGHEFISILYTSNKAHADIREGLAGLLAGGTHGDGGQQGWTARPGQRLADTTAW